MKLLTHALISAFTLSIAFSAHAADLTQIQPSDAPMGKPDAPVTIIEYASLSCPHCARFHGEILPELKKKFIDTGKASVTLRHFPLNEPALKAAMVTQCAGPERYNKFSSVFFELQKDWAFTTRFIENIKTIANVGGMASDQVDACLADLELEKEILLSRKEAAEQLKVQSTPSIYINGALYNGAFSVEGYAQAIEAALAGKVSPIPFPEKSATPAITPAPAPSTPAVE